MIPEGLAAGDEFEVEEPDWAATLEQEAAERQRQSAAPIEQIPNLPVPVRVASTASNVPRNTSSRSHAKYTLLPSVPVWMNGYTPGCVYRRC